MILKCNDHQLHPILFKQWSVQEYCKVGDRVRKEENWEGRNSHLSTQTYTGCRKSMGKDGLTPWHQKTASGANQERAFQQPEAGRESGPWWGRGRGRDEDRSCSRENKIHLHQDWNLRGPNSLLNEKCKDRSRSLNSLHSSRTWGDLYAIYYECYILWI